MKSDCATCNAEDSEDRESVGALALNGTISWREAARRLDLTHHTGLKAHMERHYVPPGPPGLEKELLEELARELKGQMANAPVELKPLYLVVIKSVLEIDKTKPSQQNMTNALKAISEITGMKMEQRMLLQFGQQMFGEVAAPPARPALGEGDTDEDEICEAEIVA